MAISHKNGIAVSTISHFSGVAKANVSAINGITASFGGGLDTDAEAFLTAISNSDGTIESAINQLVLDLKAASVWTKFDTIYPFVGGSASTHKFNLKDPQDTDGAFRMTFHGTVTHDSNGITGNGATGYGDTKWNQSTHGLTDDEHVSIYSRTDSDNAGIDCGVTGGSGEGTLLRLRTSSTQFQVRCQTTTSQIQTVSTSLGYFSSNRTASTGFRTRQNATSETKTADSDASPVNQKMFICARSVSGSASNYINRNYAWFALGSGLTETEDGNVRTAVQTFQTTLSRNV